MQWPIVGQPNRWKKRKNETGNAVRHLPQLLFDKGAVEGIGVPGWPTGGKTVTRTLTGLLAHWLFAKAVGCIIPVCLHLRLRAPQIAANIFVWQKCGCASWEEGFKFDEHSNALLQKPSTGHQSKPQTISLCMCCRTFKKELAHIEKNYPRRYTTNPIFYEY